MFWCCCEEVEPITCGVCEDEFFEIVSADKTDISGDFCDWIEDAGDWWKNTFGVASSYIYTRTTGTSTCHPNVFIPGNAEYGILNVRYILIGPEAPFSPATTTRGCSILTKIHFGGAGEEILTVTHNIDDSVSISGIGANGTFNLINGSFATAEITICLTYGPNGGWGSVTAFVRVGAGDFVPLERAFHSTTGTPANGSQVGITFNNVTVQSPRVDYFGLEVPSSSVHLGECFTCNCPCTNCCCTGISGSATITLAGIANEFSKECTLLNGTHILPRLNNCFYRKIIATNQNDDVMFDFTKGCINHPIPPAIGNFLEEIIIVLQVLPNLDFANACDLRLTISLILTCEAAGDCAAYIPAGCCPPGVGCLGWVPAAVYQKTGGRDTVCRDLQTLNLMQNFFGACSGAPPTVNVQFNPPLL